MQILNEYTQIAYSDGWIFAGVILAVIFVCLLIKVVSIIFDRYHDPDVLFAAIALASICFGAMCGSFKMANQGEEHYIQCTIYDDYRATELMKYEVVKTEGKIITLKELNYENN